MKRKIWVRSLPQVKATIPSDFEAQCVLDLPQSWPSDAHKSSESMLPPSERRLSKLSAAPVDVTLGSLNGEPGLGWGPRCREHQREQGSEILSRRRSEPQSEFGARGMEFASTPLATRIRATNPV